MKRLLTALVLVVALASTAHAEKKELEEKFTFGGRIFLRTAAAQAEGDDWRFRSTAESARLEFGYRWERLRTEVEYEFVSQKLKNAWVRLRAHDAGDVEIDVRGGQFKMPFSPIQMSSVWSLPMAQRGLLDSVLVDRLQVAGRKVGGEVEAKLGGPYKPKLVGGVFQGITDFDEAPINASLEEDGFAQDVIARASMEPGEGIEVGGAASFRSGQLALGGPIRRRWAAELDATVDIPAGPGQFRGWIEAYAGSSWLVAGTPPASTKAIFAGGRAIAAWRHGGAEKSDRFVEPYVLFGTLDPDSSFGNDLVLEATGGAAYGAWDIWRIQLEAQMWRVGDNAPVGIVEYGIAPANTTTVLLQLGAHY